jgi:hypothetical protein
MHKFLHRFGTQLSVLLLIPGVWENLPVGSEFWMKQDTLNYGRDTPKQRGKLRTPVATRDDAEPACPVSGPKGIWDYYQMRDLPRGYCSDTKACTLWTKDSCPGTDYPGPAIKWKCRCESAVWYCEELERTTTACVPLVI